MPSSGAAATATMLIIDTSQNRNPVASGKLQLLNQSDKHS